MTIPSRWWLLWTAMISVLFAYFIIGDVVAFNDAVAIQKHGNRATAEVRQVYIDGCGRRACLWRVEYLYKINQPNTGSRVILFGSDQLGNDRDPNDPHVFDAKQTGHVPIAFDITKPSRSTLNFNDDALSGRPVEQTGKHLKFGMMLYLIMVGMVTVVVFAFWGWDRLTGGNVDSLSAA